jgi:dATP pyrophosphohydrolase
MTIQRAPFQVLVFPYYVEEDGSVKYAVFRRAESTGGYWQGLAGGGQVGESPLEAAQRETREESRLEVASEFMVLDAVNSIPVLSAFGRYLWGDEVTAIPEFAFGVQAANMSIELSDEHEEYKWVDFDKALSLLKWDGNKAALRELHQRLAASPSP